MGTLRERLGAKLLGLQPGEILTVKDLTREFTALKLEWAETLDFIQHWAGRQAKRDQKAAKASLTHEPPPPGLEAAPLPETAHAAMKSELRRRAAAMRGGPTLRTGTEP